MKTDLLQIELVKTYSKKSCPNFQEAAAYLLELKDQGPVVQSIVSLTNNAVKASTR